MRIAYVDINKFRGISSARIYLNGHSVIIGDNNAGKSTILEAIDLVLGPDRLSKTPVIDEHDFYNGIYFTGDDENPKIEIELLIIDLEPSQISRFKNNLEFWDCSAKQILQPGSINEVDNSYVKEALRLKFIGSYNQDDDDFEGQTYFCSPLKDEGQLTKFGKSDKRECGFLYLRALRTGARALSLERGSLLDIILKIKELKPKMWEHVLNQLRVTTVATEPSLGIQDILLGVQEALKEFVPSDWGSEPQLRVSDLTREHLRKTLTVFMSTGEGSYHAPFQHQGTGTINTMVLALLTMIAELKKNVIFAMEEPEIAIPPYTQKRIVDSIRRKSTQAIFTSHSPFVLEEFSPSQIILVQRNKDGQVGSHEVKFPSTIKAKNYSSEFRMRFAEALLAKRVLLTEGSTEASSYLASARRLNELAPTKFKSLEALGVAVFDVMSETSIHSFGEYFTSLGKTVFAVFDKQEKISLEKINKSVPYAFESKYKGFEDLLLEETDIEVLKNCYLRLIKDNEWPTHLNNRKASNPEEISLVKDALREYLKWSKGSMGAAEIIGSCELENHVPKTVRDVLEEVQVIIETGSKSALKSSNETI